MTHPAPAPPEDERLIEEITAILTSVTTVAAARSLIRRTLTKLRLLPEAITAAVRLLKHLPTRNRPRPEQSATSATLRRAPFYTAFYLVNASRRLDAAVRNRPSGTSPGDALRNALARERTWLKAHRRMQQHRLTVAALIDRAALVWGNRLGWYTVLDPRTDAECRHAGGRDFYASRQPAIGWPGSVHAHCRCKPGPPWGTNLLPS